MTPGREITIEAIRHPRGWLMLWLMVPLIPGTPWRLNLMLNTGRPQSVISPRTRDALLVFGVLRQRGRNAYILQGAHAAGEPFADLPLRLSAGPALLGVEGMLGVDCLDLFAEVRLDTRSLRLTLVQT